MMAAISVVGDGLAVDRAGLAGVLALGEELQGADAVTAERREQAVGVGALRADALGERGADSASLSGSRLSKTAMTGSPI